MPLESFPFPRRAIASEASWSDMGSDLSSDASSWVITQQSRPPSHASTGVANLADLEGFEALEFQLPVNGGAYDGVGAADDGQMSTGDNSTASTLRCVFSLGGGALPRSFAFTEYFRLRCLTLPSHLASLLCVHLRLL